MTVETPEVRSDKRKPREKKERLCEIIVHTNNEIRNGTAGSLVNFHSTSVCNLEQFMCNLVFCWFLAIS